MFNDPRRITLLARASSSPARAWNVSRKAPNRVIFVDAVSMLNFALDRANHDVDRVLIDGTATSAEYLELLSGLPTEFVGTPGATFVYAGDQYSIPASGWVELLSSEKVYLAANGRSLPLDVWPIDAFGTRTVPLQAVPDTSPDSQGNSVTTVASNTIN